ncbi:hypothetical protein [Hyphobacterium sp.]|uniref:hypothetical protein n=1 Tax=Hyphobacterium sp. TaxID=2004662 RepID=UPI0037485A03
MSDGTNPDYSKEAVQKRLSAKRRQRESWAYWPAFVLDALVLAGSVYALWMAFTAEFSDGRIQWFGFAFVGSPAVFAISRFIRSRPTPAGWAWLAVSAFALIVIAITSFT